MRNPDEIVINDYTYYVFEEIEKRGLQFALPNKWRPIYAAFLRERKRKRGVESAGLWSDDFGNKDSTPREENPKAD